MVTIIALVLSFAFISLVLGVIYGAIWWLYISVVPVLWPSGPENLIRPGFWLFVGSFVLISLICKGIFGSKS